MSDDTPNENYFSHNGPVEVMLARIEGKLDRIGDRLSRNESDVIAVRQRIHDLANDVQPIMVLDLPGRIRVADAERAKVEARLNAIEAIENQRKGAAKLAAILWTVIGAVGAGGIVVILRLVGVAT